MPMNDENTIDFHLFATLISNLLSIHVTSVTEPDKDLAEFENKFCFNGNLQPMFSAQVLQFLLESSDAGTLYEITDKMDVSLLFFQFKGRPFLVGPYVRNEYNDGKMQSVLAERGLSASYSLSLKLYYTSLPLLSAYHAQKEIEACILSFAPASPLYSFRKLYGISEDKKPVVQYKEESVDYRTIMRRYDYENHFLNMVSSGNVKQVLEAFLEMEKGGRSEDKGMIYMNNPQVSTSILRTLIRKAAEKSGLSPIIIDEITERHAQISITCRNTAELIGHTKEMILELTQAVHDHLHEAGNYTPIISKMVELVNMNFSEPISLSTIAEENHVSESYLSKRFKKETGETFGAYLSKRRCEKAAQMLKETSLQIQEISSYIGYPDNNYFIKVFRKQYGCTPTKYRQG